MRVLAIIAADVDPAGNSVLRAGDRAAAQWGIVQTAAACNVRHPRGDRVAAAYAAALGASGAVWQPAEPVAADLVLIGPGAIDVWGDELAGRLAEQLDAELLFDVQHIERQGAIWNVTCDAGRGAHDICQVAGRLVLVLSQHVPRPPYVSSYRRRQSEQSQRIDKTSAISAADWQPVVPRARRAVTGAEVNAEERANAAFGIAVAAAPARDRQVIADSAEVCAQVLLRYLVHHGFLDRALPEIATPDVGVLATAPATHEEAASSPRPSFGLIPALHRSPRMSGDDERRRARRPRPESSATSSTRAPAATALQRGPRRPGAVAGRRGPFRLPVSQHTISQ